MTTRRSAQNYSYQLKTLAEGGCVRCGAARETYARYCDLCQENVRNYMREYMRKKAGTPESKRRGPYGPRPRRKKS